jgi:hypothetical protein
LKLVDIARDEAKWAVAILEPNRDLTAERALRRDGYRVVYLCWRKLLTGHRGDWRKTSAFVSRPLFEGYAFVQLWDGQEWPDPERIAGYMGLVGRSAPTWIDHATVSDWQARTQAGLFDDRRPEKRKSGPGFVPANSEEERAKVLRELRAKLGGTQYAEAS